MRRFLAIGALGGALVCLGACARLGVPSPAGVLPPRVPPDGRWHVAVQPSVRVGGASGYLQTPRGGGAGTTDPRRPTLKEIGVTTATEVGGQVRVDYGRHQAVLEYGQLMLHGDAVLRQGLTSQAAAFPAGTAVDSDTNLHVMSARYHYLFELPVGPVDRVELRPGAGVRGVGVDYRLVGSNGAQTDRDYTTFAPMVALDWSWRPRSEGNLTFGGHLGHSLDVFLSERRRMSVFDATARMHYGLSRRASVYLETGYRHMLLDDIQPVMQNRIHVDYGPWVGLGADLRW